MTDFHFNGNLSEAGDESKLTALYPNFPVRGVRWIINLLFSLLILDSNSIKFNHLYQVAEADINIERTLVLTAVTLIFNWSQVVNKLFI